MDDADDNNAFSTKRISWTSTARFRLEVRGAGRKDDGLRQHRHDGPVCSGKRLQPVRARPLMAAS